MKRGIALLSYFVKKRGKERETNGTKKVCVYGEPLKAAPLTLHPNCYTGTLVLVRLHKSIKPRLWIRSRDSLHFVCLCCSYACSRAEGCWLGGAGVSLACWWQVAQHRLLAVSASAGSQHFTNRFELTAPTLCFGDKYVLTFRTDFQWRHMVLT